MDMKITRVLAALPDQMHTASNTCPPASDGRIKQ